MRIVSMFALCFALSACTEEEAVTVLEPVALGVAVADGGAVAAEQPAATPTSVVVGEGSDQLPSPLPPSVTTPSDGLTSGQ
jgi:hypothetical protein